MRKLARHATTLGLATAGLLAAVLPASAGETTRVSVSSAEAQANGESFWATISGDGRFVAFRSTATNLVPGATNDQSDVFVRDRQTGTTRLMSVSSTEAPGNADSSLAAISGDGRFVAFASDASNLVPNDTNFHRDVFVRDRQGGTTARVSVSSSGAQANSISDDPAISVDGRFVAFHSEASNLVRGDTNGQGDVFIRDRHTGTTTRVSVSSTGAQGNDASFGSALSRDGRFVAFQSLASNLVPGDTNGFDDVFVRDRRTGTTRRVSVSSSGAQANGGSGFPAVSADGRFVAFDSGASNLVQGDTNGQGDVFIRDRQTGTTRRVSVSSFGAQGSGGVFGSGSPAISADGRFVAFESDASNFTPADTNRAFDVFIRDGKLRTTERLSVALAGTSAFGFIGSFRPAISGEGRFIAFDSGAPNLVPGDTNDVPDVFLRDRRPTAPADSHSRAGAQP